MKRFKNLLQNKTVVGILSIATSGLFAFFVLNAENSSIENVTVITTTSNINAGEKIKEEMLKEIKLEGVVPDNVIKSKDEVIGKYTSVNITTNDILTKEKLSSEAVYGSAYLENLKGNKQAISISLDSLAIGLSGKLESGDIVSVIVSEEEDIQNSQIPKELKYVEIISVSDTNGYDIKKSNEENSQSKSVGATATLLVSEEQAKILAGLELNGNIHLSLVYRGNDDYKQKLLDEQNLMFIKEVSDEHSENISSEYTANNLVSEPTTEQTTKLETETTTKIN